MEESNTFLVTLYFETRELSFEFIENQEKNLSTLLLSLKSQGNQLLEIKQVDFDIHVDMNKVLYYKIERLNHNE